MADVKFSELTALAAATVDAADVLAIVDTSASTSKKLSIDNLFGAVPVNIAVADATDSGSISTGSIQTAGGIGVTKALSVGTTSTFTGNILPAASGTVDIGSASAEINDMFFSTGSVLNFADGQEVTVTAATTGLTINTDKKIMFRDTALSISSSADAALDLISDGSINATVGAAGMVLKGTTPKLTIGDAGAEDTFLVFDGNAQDYRIGLDDGTDILEMGVGAAHGTTPSLKLEADLNVDVAGHNGTVGLKLGGTVVGSTAAELNLLDGSAKSTSSITIADADAFIVIDGSTTKQIPASDLETYLEASLDTLTSVTAVGTLTGLTVSGAIIPNASGTIDIGSTAAEFNDIFLADASVINFGADQDVTLTHVADAAIMLNTTMALRWRDATLGINSSTNGQLDIYADAELEITSPIVDIDASTSVNISNDLKLDSDSAVLGFGADNDATLTHTDDVGITLNSTNKLMFNDATQFVQGISATVLGLGATDEIDLTATAVDINATVNASGLVTIQTGMVPDASDGAYLGTSSLEFSDLFLADGAVIALGDGGADVTLTHVADTGVLLNTDNVIQFRDSGLNIGSSADGTLDVVADTILDLDAATVTLTKAGADQVIKHATDVYDLAFQQTDGNEVARIHDGATAATLETTALDLTAGAAGKGGFGFKRPVYNVTASADDADCLLAMKHSGAMIMVTGSAYDMDIILPVIAAGDEGWHVTVAVTTAFSGTNNLEIATNGHGDATDRIYMYMNTAGTSGAEATANDDVVKFVDDVAAGTLCRMTCVKGGANEVWIAEVFQPSGTAATTTAAVA